MGHDSRNMKVARVRLLSRAVARKALCTAVAGAAVVVGVLVGCSSTDDASAPRAATLASPPCPATLEKTNGATCATEATSCTPSFPCGATNQVAKCTCTKGKFACEDGAGLLVPGKPPTCGGAAPPSPACPASVAAAEGKTCTQAYQECVYKGTECANSDRPAADICYCHGNGAGLSFRCEVSRCSPPPPPPPPREAGAPGFVADDAAASADSAGGD